MSEEQNINSKEENVNEKNSQHFPEDTHAAKLSQQSPGMSDEQTYCRKIPQNKF
jgi:hypothetical protein